MCLGHLPIIVKGVLIPASILVNYRMNVMIDISVLQYSTVELLKSGKLWSVASYPSYNDFKYMGHGRFLGIVKGVLHNHFILPQMQGCKKIGTTVLGVLKKVCVQ